MESQQDHIIFNVNHETEAKITVDVSMSVPEHEEPKRYCYYSEGAKKLTTSINRKLSRLEPDPLNYGTVCIYKIPEKQRNKNQQAYTPRLVSIGPLHRGQSELQPMEEYKLKYLSNFLQTFHVPLELLSEYVHSQEKLVRGCYEDASMRNGLELSEVMLLDGVFIVELFLKNHFPEMREMGDVLFDNPWVKNDVLHDLLLFENQLPMRFLCTLYNAFVTKSVRKFLDDDTVDAPSFNDLVKEYFRSVGNTGKLELITRSLLRARHLVEFLAILHEPKYPRDEQRRAKKPESAHCATATDLLAAGVKFRRGEERCLFEIHFNQGELTIPQLTVNDSTETFFRNLIAFEQTGYHSKNITSYVILFDNLIDTNKDVDLLIRHGIIKNQLGTSEQVAEVFNSLYKEFVTDPKEFYFAELCRRLNEYSRDIWHKWNSKCSKWFAMLGRDYFGSPWSIISVIAAAILLVLTVIQTVFSVLQVV